MKMINNLVVYKQEEQKELIKYLNNKIRKPFILTDKKFAIVGDVITAVATVQILDDKHE